MKKIIQISACLMLIVSGVSVTYAEITGSTDLVQLNTQLQAQMKQLQTDLQQQILTLNTQMQNQIKQMQATLQDQIQKLNTQLEGEIGQLKTGLQTQINQIQAEVNALQKKS
jgi:DNA anti-recombination protein RmuC